MEMSPHGFSTERNDSEGPSPFLRATQHPEEVELEVEIEEMQAIIQSKPKGRLTGVRNKIIQTKERVIGLM